MAQRSRRKCSTECKWKIWYNRYVEYWGIMVKAFKATLSNWQKRTAVRFLSQSRKGLTIAQRGPLSRPIAGGITHSRMIRLTKKCTRSSVEQNSRTVCKEQSAEKKRSWRPCREASCRGSLPGQLETLAWSDLQIYVHYGTPGTRSGTTKQLSMIAAKRLRICKFATGQDAFTRESLDEHSSERKISEKSCIAYQNASLHRAFTYVIYFLQFLCNLFVTLKTMQNCNLLTDLQYVAKSGLWMLGYF